MESREAFVKKLGHEIKDYLDSQKQEFVPGKTKISVQAPSYGWEEIEESLDSLLSTWITMGKKVEAFENAFAGYLGAKHATMVNSGSSANLIAMSILTNKALKSAMPPGSEVITPTTTWATTVYPIADVNCVPVLVDVNRYDYNISIDAIEKAITPKTKAILPVHLLGTPCEIDRIMEIAEKHDLAVIEDTCESHGAEVNGKKAGTFGGIGTFSFFFSHHISTIEGGMVVTNNSEYHELARALRVFGWARSMGNYEEYASKYKHIDKRFLFVNRGFNMRPTEIHGAFGIQQIKKLEKFIQQRRENAAYWSKRFEEVSDYIAVVKERPKTRNVWFSYPITVREGAPFTRDEMVKHLEERMIETRPIQIPNMLEQPAIKMLTHRPHPVKNAEYIAKNAFWFGNHQSIGAPEREFIADTIVDFINSRKKRA